LDEFRTHGDETRPRSIGSPTPAARSTVPVDGLPTVYGSVNDS